MLQKQWFPLLLAAGLAFAPSVQGDEPLLDLTGVEEGLNIPMLTMGGKQFWGDELVFHDWRIQRNVNTGHYRLLNKYDVRIAWGSFAHCRQRLEEIRREEEIPPVRGKVVIAVHGLIRARASMEPLGDYLSEHGNYTVLYVGYPSTRGGVANHARSLARVIAYLDEVEEINFIAHSMGNIVIRHYLADHTDPARGLAPDPRLGRMVMLGPPNHGSCVAEEVLAGGPIAELYGVPGKELGCEWETLEKRLVTPDLEFGVIAGGLGTEIGFNPLIPGDDDGVVSVASTRLAGAADFRRVAAVHALLMADRDVQEYTCCFLRHGYFESPEERRPILSDDDALGTE